MTLHTFRANPYKCPIYCCTSPRAYRRLVLQWGYDLPWPTHWGGVQRLDTDGAPVLVITIPNPDAMTWAQLAGVAAHEATHVLQYVKAAISEKAMGREAEAYFVEAVTEWLVDSVVN